MTVLGAAALLPVLVKGQGQSQNAPQPEVQQAIHHDVSPPLRISRYTRCGRQTRETLRLVPLDPPNIRKIHVVQGNVNPLVATTSGLNFAGVGNGDYGFTPNAAPPDTNARWERHSRPMGQRILCGFR